MTKLQLVNIEINYISAGEGDSILFIHGLGSSARDWEYQFDSFSKNYRVVAYDLRGHGQSAKPRGPYSIPLFAWDTAALIKALDLAPVHVVGVSLGGMIGFQLAIDAPEMVRSLVIVNSTPEMVVRTIKERVEVWQRILIVRLLGMRKMGEVIGARLFPKPEQADMRAIFTERWAENDPRAWLDSFKAIVGWSVSDQLEKITCPVLVVAAEQDYTPVSTKEAYIEELTRGELVVIKDSRHGTPVDQPEAFNQALLTFFNRQK
jgi:3-oxoadipate enol-lactonase